MPDTQATVPTVAVVSWLLGAVVENAKQNWFVGTRTPRALSSEEA